jgi:hypothetical protein
LTLGNVRPCFRSKLKSIYLIGVAKTASIRAKDGVARLLENFLSCLNKLVDGHVFIIQEVETVIRRVIVLLWKQFHQRF